jgi:hypothetical protein
MAIKAPETTALMISYLPDEHFGETAALVLKAQWIVANEPKDERRFKGSVDLSRVEEVRVLRAVIKDCQGKKCGPYRHQVEYHRVTPDQGSEPARAALLNGWCGRPLSTCSGSNSCCCWAVANQSRHERNTHWKHDQINHDIKASDNATSVPVREGETESAVRNRPYTVHGWRPTSVVVQPVITATKPNGATHRHKRRNQTESQSRPRTGNSSRPVTVGGSPALN